MGVLFDEERFCHAHSIKECGTCRSKESKATKPVDTTALALIAPSQGVGHQAGKLNEMDKIETALDFVQTSLKLSDKELEKIKMTDLAAKVEEANKKITVAGMRKIMGRQKKKIGITGRMAIAFASLFPAKKRGY